MSNYTKIYHPILDPIQYILKDHGEFGWKLNFGDIIAISKTDNEIAVSFVLNESSVERWHGDYFVIELLDVHDRIICYEKVKRQKDKKIYTGRFGLCVIG